MEITLKDLKELFNNDKSETFLEVGEMYQIRTVTMIYTGSIKAMNKTELLLEQCCWIPDTGRYADSLKDTDKYDEVEPYKYDTIIYKGVILDITKFDKLPKDQK